MVGGADRLATVRGDDTKTDPKPKPVPAPTLPAGAKIDLTHPTIEVDDVEFEIPKTIPTAGNRHEVRTAISLTPVEWLTVARNNRLLYGLDLERALSGAGGFEAEHAALVWQVPDGDDFVQPIDSSSSEASVVYSERLASFAECRIVEASLEASFPFVGATAEARRAEKHARGSALKTLHMSGKWNYPRARLRLEFSTAIAPRLVEALEAALGQPGEASRFLALQDVFRSFGHVVPKNVLIGGQMFFEMDQSVSVNVDDSAVESTIKAAIAIQTPDGGGSGGAGFEVAKGKRVEAQDIVRNTKWRCIGGDTTLDGNPGEWRETVKNPNLWSVIEREGLVALTDRLEAEHPDLAHRVRAVWESRLGHFWAGHPPPEDYVLPPFGGEPFTLSRDKATNAPTVSAGQRKPMTTEMFEEIPSSYLSNTKLKQPGISALHKALRTAIGSTPELKPYLDELYYEEAPARFGRLVADTNGMYDPATHGCLWTLVYTGAINDRGEPYFWIVEFDRADADRILLAQTPARPGTVIVAPNPLDDLERADMLAAIMATPEFGEVKKMLDPFPEAVVPTLRKEFRLPVRGRLGYVLGDRVLKEPPLRLSDNRGLLDGAFWTFAPVEGRDGFYSLRSANGYSFDLSHPEKLATGGEVCAWRDQAVRAVYAVTQAN